MDMLLKTFGRISNSFSCRKKKKKNNGKIKKGGRKERKRHEPKTVPFKIGKWHKYGCSGSRSSASG